MPEARRWPPPCGEAKVCVEQPGAQAAIGRAVEEFGVDAARRAGGDVVVLCVGTDRSTGDALGPLVGSFLSEDGPPRPYFVYGTLDQPVHASNLGEALGWLESRHRHPLVIAVDACLGRLDAVGTITVGRGALRPGAGVNKNLPSVGHVYVTGVVNVGGFMEYFVLQNTRLGLVVRMARVIAGGIGAAATRLAAGHGGGARSESARG